MPHFYSEYFYTWGYAATSLALVIVALVAGVALIRKYTSVGVSLLVAGVILITGGLTVHYLGWLILAGGDNSMDGFNERGRIKILDISRQVEVGMSFFGALAIVLSLLFLSRDFGALKRHNE